MENIKIVFLGTGSAIPTINRNHNGIYLKYRDRNFLIDCGEGIQRQIRKAGLNICKINDILITHVHGDHILGLPGLLHTMSKSEYNKKLNIYCPKNSGNFIKKFLKLTGVHDINYKVTEVNGKFIENDFFSFSCLPLKHDVSCNGYLFQEKDKLRINKKELSNYKIKGEEIGRLVNGKNIYFNGKKINYKDLTYLEKGRKISFIFDTEFCDNINKLIFNSDLAIIEGVFLNSDRENLENLKHYKHLTIEDAANLSKKNKVKKLIVSHISQRYEFKEKILLKKAEKIFRSTIIAEDFMIVNL
ncbi:MAG: ribonuclease Z [Nanoarchaeota archaeon]